MKRIIAKVLMFLFPERCEEARRRVMARRAEMRREMQRMLDRARFYRDAGYTTRDINCMMRLSLRDYEQQEY